MFAWNVTFKETFRRKVTHPFENADVDVILVVMTGIELLANGIFPTTWKLSASITPKDPNEKLNTHF